MCVYMINMIYMIYYIYFLNDDNIITYYIYTHIIFKHDVKVYKRYI